MSIFGVAYTDFVTPDARFAHSIQREQAGAVRAILQAPRTDEVAPPPPPPGIDWTLISDDEFVKEYLNRFGDWANIDIAITHRKGVNWTRSWKG